MNDELIFEVLVQTVSNTFILIIGWLLARYTINGYQKRKDDKDIKEKLLNEATDLTKRYMEFYDKISKWNRLNSNDSNPNETLIFKDAFSTSVDFFVLNLTNLILKIRMHFELDQKNIQELDNFKNEITRLLNSMRILMRKDQLIEINMIHDYSKYSDDIADLGNIAFFSNVK